MLMSGQSFWSSVAGRRHVHVTGDLGRRGRRVLGVDATCRQREMNASYEAWVGRRIRAFPNPSNPSKLASGSHRPTGHDVLGTTAPKMANLSSTWVQR